MGLPRRRDWSCWAYNHAVGLNSQKPSEGPEQRMFQHKLVAGRPGAYQNSHLRGGGGEMWRGGRSSAVRRARQGMIVNPDGEIIAQAKTEDDELVVGRLRFSTPPAFGKQNRVRLQAATAALSITAVSPRRTGRYFCRPDAS